MADLGLGQSEHLPAFYIGHDPGCGNLRYRRAAPCRVCTVANFSIERAFRSSAGE
jgi:hypothetical protein